MDRVDDVADASLLAVTFAFMVWSRARSYGSFITQEKVFLAGNDAYYHLRQINYVVQNWPFTMPFDPWTNFPVGTSQGQFGTLFDVAIATAAIIVGGGNPSYRTITIVAAVAPVVIGSLVILPTYGLGRRVGDRTTARIAVVLLALIPGVFYTRSLFGTADHNIAEVLLQSVVVLAFVVAIDVAYRDQPVWENVLDRDLQPFKRTMVFSLLATVATLLYILVWPPAVVIVGIVGFYYLLSMSRRSQQSESIDQLAFTGAISFISLGLLLLPAWNWQFSATRLSSLQVAIPIIVGLTCVYLAVLDRHWPDIDRSYYPVAVIITAAVAAGFVAIIMPDLFRIVLTNVERIFAFGATSSTRTIAEARSVPAGQLSAFLFNQYGLLMLAAVAGFGFLVNRRTVSLTVVWSASVFIMAINQIRFHYYLAVVVAILAAVAFSRIFDLIDLTTFKELKPYQVLSIAAVLLFVLAPLAPPLGGTTVFDTNRGPGGVQVWSESLDWVESETPDPGLDYYGTFERTEDFDYPASAYGVLSWWDYGHWITVEAERIAVANPFQQNARLASAFFLSSSEREAAEAIGGPSDDEPVKYVMIDWQMVSGKFPAIATWTGPPPSHYYGIQQRRVGDSVSRLRGPSDNYYDTMIAKLYLEDTNGLSHYRLVHETKQQVAIGSVAQLVNGQYRETNILNQYLSRSIINTVTNRQDLEFYSVNQVSAVKTYEYVDGATIIGEANTSRVTLRLLLRTNADRGFVYQQTVAVNNGTYRATVPYSTENVTAIQPVSDYQVIAGNETITSFTVTENAVQNGSRVVVSS